MKTLKNSAVIAFITILLFAACTKKQILKKYYVFDFSTDSLQLALQKPLPYAVTVDPFDINPAFRTKKIALRSKSNELQYYYYHQWAEAPDVALRFLVWRKLRDVHLFEKTLFQASHTFPDFLVHGTIDVIEMAQTPKKNSPAAHIKGSLELINFKSGATVVAHDFERWFNLPDDNSMNDFVRITKNLFNQEIDKFIIKIAMKVR